MLGPQIRKYSIIWAASLADLHSLYANNKNTD